ncbi:MAG TPA: serine/threonine-protein kinase [Polyangiaceae bacterium]|jgi:serine/threonine-protein kinase|nr:serine/threonine-protein kinase [Polyangiaceae bacterium]
MSAPLVSEQSGPPKLPEGAIIAGRYKILGFIGAGGMGAVYRAEHVHMRKTVALKLLHKEFLGVDEVVARFEREAIAAARIEHPNVVAASDFGKLEDGSFYLVLEFVAGTSLRALIEKNGALPLARTLRIAQQTVQALGAAHAAGVVHRDLKPDNVMLVATSDGTDRVKVLDFGIARIAQPDPKRDSTKLTQVGMVMGTVAYMSPEQATGQAVDERTDLYSLGIMLYEMIAGRVPFDAELPSQVLARQLVEEPPPLPVSTPPALARLVLDLMQKKPEDRPATAQEVLDRLAELTATPSGRVLAPPEPPRVLLYAIAGAIAVIGALAFALSGKKSEPTPASAEPSASAPSESATGDRSDAPVEVRSAVPPAASVVAPAASASAASVPESTKGTRPSSKGSSKSAPATTTPKGKEKPASPPPQGETKRRTGPGGIYIPPPSEWFK